LTPKKQALIGQDQVLNFQVQGPCLDPTLESLMTPMEQILKMDNLSG
jgi:hypothetical protein